MLITDLPEELKELALKEIEAQRNRGLIKEGRSGRKLIDSFFWHPSEKGYDFWKAINDSEEAPGKTEIPFFGAHKKSRNVSPRKVIA